MGGAWGGHWSRSVGVGWNGRRLEVSVMCVRVESDAGYRLITRTAHRRGADEGRRRDIGGGETGGGKRGGHDG